MLDVSKAPTCSPRSEISFSNGNSRDHPPSLWLSVCCSLPVGCHGTAAILVYFILFYLFVIKYDVINVQAWTEMESMRNSGSEHEPEKNEQCGKVRLSVTSWKVNSSIRFQVEVTHRRAQVTLVLECVEVASNVNDKNNKIQYWALNDKKKKTLYRVNPDYFLTRACKGKRISGSCDTLLLSISARSVTIYSLLSLCASSVFNKSTLL